MSSWKPSLCKRTGAPSGVQDPDTRAPSVGRLASALPVTPRLPCVPGQLRTHSSLQGTSQGRQGASSERRKGPVAALSRDQWGRPCGAPSHWPEGYNHDLVGGRGGVCPQSSCLSKHGRLLRGHGLRWCRSRLGPARRAAETQAGVASASALGRGESGWPPGGGRPTVLGVCASPAGPATSQGPAARRRPSRRPAPALHRPHLLQ